MSKVTEIEFIWHGFINDFDEIERLSIGCEEIEQWELRNVGPLGFLQRVRKSIVNVNGKFSGPEFTFTMKKVLSPGNKKQPMRMLEKDLIIDQDFFDTFKIMSEGGLNKKRFFIPIQGSKFGFEVDCYLDSNGEYFPMVKIDLEVDLAWKGPAPEFNFPVQGVIAGSSSSRTAKENAYIQSNYDKFLLKPPAL